MFETVENRYTLRRGTFSVFICLPVNDQIKKSHDCSNYPKPIICTPNFMTKCDNALLFYNNS